MNTYRNILLVGAAMLLSFGALTTASAHPGYYGRHGGYYGHHGYYGRHGVIVNPAPVYAYRPYRHHRYYDYGYYGNPYRNNVIIRGGYRHYR